MKYRCKNTVTGPFEYSTVYALKYFRSEIEGNYLLSLNYDVFQVGEDEINWIKSLC